MTQDEIAFHKRRIQDEKKLWLQWLYNLKFPGRRAKYKDHRPLSTVLQDWYALCDDKLDSLSL